MNELQNLINVVIVKLGKLVHKQTCSHDLFWTLVKKPESSWYLIWACVWGFVSLKLSISIDIEVLMFSLLLVKRTLDYTSNYRRFVSSCHTI